MAKLENLSSITLGYLASRDGSCKTKHWKRMKKLFASGCAATLVNHELVKDLKQSRDKKTRWRTKAGKFTTSNKCNITFKLPAFYEHREITWNCYVDTTNTNICNYDLIIGRDLMHEIGINILFKDAVLEWDGATIPMQSTDKLDETYLDEFEQEILLSEDPITTEAERIQRIVEAKYSKADLPQVAKSCKTISEEEQEHLLASLKKFEHLFDGTLGTWNTEPVDLELKDPNCKPCHAKPYPVPHAHEQLLKEEMDRLCNYGVVRKINSSEWASPVFTVPKSDNTLRSIGDFRAVNTHIRRKPFPLPKISDLLHKLEGFTYAISLDLTMGY